MSYDGVFLHKIVEELQLLKTGRLTKVHQVSNSDILFIIRANRENYNLIISTSGEYSRVHLSTGEYITPQTPTSFTMFMRKHIEGNIILDISQYECDRILIIKTGGCNELGDYQEKQIIVEIMGRYSNFIIANDNKILDSLKHQGLFDAKRTMMPNALYTYPELGDKINPLPLSIEEIEAIMSNHKISSPKDICATFQGVSPLLSTIIFNSKLMADKMYHLINEKVNPTIFTNRNRRDFYYLNDSFLEPQSYATLSSMLDAYYYDLGNNERIKQKTNDVGLLVNRSLKRNDEKLNKLQFELVEAKNGDVYRLYGELLLANLYQIYDVSSQIEVLNYYNNENLTIPLDPKYNLNVNSKMYFKKYQKSKSAIIHINDQLTKTQEEIEYFKILASQIKTANLNDIMEIQQELEELKYVAATKKKGKSQKPKILTYETIDATRIMVGKNNLQNEMVTHKLALPNEMWFHVKDGPGSHVVVKKIASLTEMDIRCAALLASYYSPNRDSSSVPVCYTLIRYIKKIPGKKTCFVTMSHEKTIFIDPSIELINLLKVVK